MLACAYMYMFPCTNHNRMPQPYDSQGSLQLFIFVACGFIVSFCIFLCALFYSGLQRCSSQPKVLKYGKIYLHTIFLFFLTQLWLKRTLYFYIIYQLWYTDTEITQLHSIFIPLYLPIRSVVREGVAKGFNIMSVVTHHEELSLTMTSFLFCCQIFLFLVGQQHDN